MKLNVLKRVTILSFVFALVACGTLALSGVFSARTEAEQIAPIEMQTAIEAVNETYVSVTAPAAEPMFAAYGMNILRDTPTPFAGSTSGTILTNTGSVEYKVDPKDMLFTGKFLDVYVNISNNTIFNLGTIDYRIVPHFYNSMGMEIMEYNLRSGSLTGDGVKSGAPKMKAPEAAIYVTVTITVRVNDASAGTPFPEWESITTSKIYYNK